MRRGDPHLCGEGGLVVGDLLKRWHASLGEHSPAAVATVVEGPLIGGKILVTPEDHVGSMAWMGPDRSARRPPGCPVCWAMISAAIAIAVSSGVRAPM